MIYRLLDIVLAAFLLVVLAVPIAVIAFAILLTDGRPVIFRQPRVGKDLRPFTILKFRTMRATPAEQPAGGCQESATDKARMRARFRTTTRGDPRITQIGRILRAGHLDELPQLLNILAGHMSLVGVRPDTPWQEVDYPPAYWVERHRYRPGITGPAQIVSNDLDMDGRTAAEKTWLEDRTVTRYFAILIRTAGKVLKRSSF